METIFVGPVCEYRSEGIMKILFFSFLFEGAVKLNKICNHLWGRCYYSVRKYRYESLHNQVQLFQFR